MTHPTHLSLSSIMERHFSQNIHLCLNLPSFNLLSSIVLTFDLLDQIANTKTIPYTRGLYHANVISNVS